MQAIAPESRAFSDVRTEISGIGNCTSPLTAVLTMSSRADSAVPTRLSSIRNELIGKKLRVVGKYVPYQVEIMLVVPQLTFSQDTEL